MVKKPVEVERLLHWMVDELSKLHMSSAEGTWDRLAKYGSLGGVNPDKHRWAGGGAQRYAQFGVPHDDAFKIADAVAALPDGSLDWVAEIDPTLGDLLKMARAPRYPQPARNRGHTFITYRDKYRDKIGWRTEAVMPPPIDPTPSPRLATAVLIAMHANMGTRPEWHAVRVRAVRIPPKHGGGETIIIGECKGRDRYTEGSYCPLRWEPSPAAIASACGDYLAWWRGLAQLADSLELEAHTVLPPAAPEFPWNEPEAEPHVFLEEDIAPHDRLPLAPQRDRAGPPPTRPRHGPVTMIELKRR